MSLQCVRVCVLLLSAVVLAGCTSEPNAADLVRLAETMVEAHNAQRPMDHISLERITPGECSAAGTQTGYICEIEIVTSNPVFGRTASTFSLSIVANGRGYWFLASPPLLVAQSAL